MSHIANNLFHHKNTFCKSSTCARVAIFSPCQYRYHKFIESMTIFSIFRVKLLSNQLESHFFSCTLINSLYILILSQHEHIRYRWKEKRIIAFTLFLHINCAEEKRAQFGDLVICFLIIFRSICCVHIDSLCIYLHVLWMRHDSKLRGFIVVFMNFDRSQFICSREIECQIWL